MKKQAPVVKIGSKMKMNMHTSPNTQILTSEDANVRSESWYKTPLGDPRGYIDAHSLKELWFHTGTACNLACDFCLEGSKPGDTRLGLIKVADVVPHIEEALELGVEQFSFTGGEPFVAKDFVKILALASSHKPCLVLTNGTDAIQKRSKELGPLLSSKYPISFRVSLDHFDDKIHDLGRGVGNFASAINGLKMLHKMGFSISVARHMSPDEDDNVIAQEYKNLFVKNSLPEDLPMVAFPDFALPGSLPDVPYVTTNCMTSFQSDASRKEFMCGFSKMIVKKDGEMRVYACTLVDDDEEYDLGGSLKESMQERVSMKHHRCYSCFAYGSSCSEL